MAESEEWNKELEEEVSVGDPRSLVVFSRDWTVETILRQVQRKNIDLNPKFQRRNAWTDDKRSKLIESLLIGVPVPEIVLAEDIQKKGAFLVIDGKQRLSAVAGFVDSTLGFWGAPKLRGLKTRPDLNGKAFDDLATPGMEESEDQRNLLNSDIRCTVISNYKDVGVLYDIFYRLNAGSVPLSSQELRQVLNRGPFAEYLIDATDKKIPLQTVMRLDGPDARLRDAEILLRYIAIVMFGLRYEGNLSLFLDRSMAEINASWDKCKAEIDAVTSDFNNATARLLKVFPENKVGRKFTRGNWESRFNRALFEVQVYFFSGIKDRDIDNEKATALVEGFKRLCGENAQFQEAVETTTKTVERYYTRFNFFRDLMIEVFGADQRKVPVSSPEK